MTEQMEVDVCVIGAGAAGLTATSGAAQLGLKTVLIEAQDMGGECLNTGCVPSKALLSAAAAAQKAAGTPKLGVTTSGDVQVDFPKVMAHVRRAIKAIEPHDCQERFEGLGAQVIRDWARFEGPDRLSVGGKTIRFKQAVIATGSAPAIPPIEGIADIPVLTNENLWDLKELPEHLLIIGAGAIGAEMGQAFRGLGAKVSIFERDSLLGRVEPEAADLARARLKGEDIKLFEQTDVVSLKRARSGTITLTYSNKDGEKSTRGSHLLVAAGRKVETERLNLEAAGVDRDRRGIIVDDRLRTSNKKIYALGDCNGQYQLTHAAGQEGGHFIKSALFKLPFAIKRAGMVHVTYIDPEVAQAGMTEAEARAEYGQDIQILRSSFADNDRAISEGVGEGYGKVVLSPKGKILGASIAGPHAGELIHLWALAIDQGLKLRQLTSYIAPYPTFSELNKAMAGSYFTDTLFSPRVKSIIAFLNRFS